jgi:hypothetical protein
VFRLGRCSEHRWGEHSVIVGRHQAASGCDRFGCYADPGRRVAPAGPESGAGFAVASVNLGVAAVVTVTVDWGDITLPVSLTICQTNPTTGACLDAPTTSITVMIAANTTPTFGFFVTAESALPFFPSHVRAFVRFRDSTGNVRGSTSIALTTLPALSPGQTAGGFYIGVFRITSGRFLGASGMTKFLISEDGEARGVT